MNISVFRVGFRTASAHVSKTIAAEMVAAGLCFWISKRAIQEHFVAKPKLASTHRFTNIPKKLPPAEVGGCHFQLPNSPQWRREHRRTVLGIELIQ